MNLIRLGDTSIDFNNITIETFDQWIYSIIKNHANYDNLGIKVNNLDTETRYKLHCFERKRNIIIFSVGKIKENKRDMIFQLSKCYIKKLIN